MEPALASVYFYVRRLDTCQYIGGDANATKDSRRMADKKPENDPQCDEPNPWERFGVFGSKGAAVPKEADEKRCEYEQERDKEQAG
jgi:hypothetical protein